MARTIKGYEPLKAAIDEIASEINGDAAEYPVTHLEFCVIGHLED
jgi:hypothetical protein